MGKRKREDGTSQATRLNGKARKTAHVERGRAHIQVVAGSYERVLHGLVVTLPARVLRPEQDSKPESGKEKDLAEKPGKDHEAEEAEEQEDLDITFTDSFLFNAHASAIKCLALSPVPRATDAAQKLLLATGSTDEKINIYTLSATPPPAPRKGEVALPSLSGIEVRQNQSNKELGSLNHHERPVSALSFPTRSKLISASEDNIIAISRTRDWTVLSTIKAPIPKAIGRPSGDTAAPGEVPCGINSFAVHPSMRLMLSVGKGERCMRLWNLVTGKKAGVLNFEKDMLRRVGEGKYGTGEGRRILWNSTGETFVVGFERGACIFDIDCVIRAVVVPRPPTKLHHMAYVEKDVLAISTEDGRILFIDAEVASRSGDAAQTEKPTTEVPEARIIAQLGGRALGVTSRIKDFVILRGERDGATDDDEKEERTESSRGNLVLVTACSDGTIRLWTTSIDEIELARVVSPSSKEREKIPQIGHLLAQYDTGHRITCLAAFVMNEAMGDEGMLEGEMEGEEAEFGGFSTGPESDEESEGDDK